MPPSPALPSGMPAGRATSTTSTSLDSSSASISAASRSAAARIVDYHASLWLAELWGGREVASIDGMRFVVPYRTFHARFNRRYFHRRRGVTALGTTADHYAGIHTIVVPGTQPDWLYLLDGLRDPQTSVQPTQIMSDTAGYSLMWTPGCSITAKPLVDGNTGGRVRSPGGATNSSAGAAMLAGVGGRRCGLCEFGLQMRLGASALSWSTSLARRSRWCRRFCAISPRGAVRRTRSRRTRMTCGTCGAFSSPTALTGESSGHRTRLSCWRRYGRRRAAGRRSGSG